ASAFVAQPREDAEQTFDLGGRQSRSRLIEDDDARAREQHAGELDELLLAAKASRVDRKWTSFPSTRMVPESAAWTPAMIFIIVLLPAPFSPARPWISPAFSVKSTFRSAWTPPNDFEMSVSSSSAIGLRQLRSGTGPAFKACRQ